MTSTSLKKRTKRTKTLDYNSDPELDSSNVDAYKRRSLQAFDSASANLNMMQMGPLEIPDILSQMTVALNPET